jgi:type IV secretion system protein VirB1
MDLLTLIAACAPLVSPTVMKGITMEESRGNPYAIYDSGGKRSLFPATRAEAIAEAKRLRAAGIRIDAGLVQINSENWDWLGLDVESVFDPCTNLAAGETVLLGAYTTAPYTLDAAISRYNSGDAKRGIRNGYVGRVKRWMGEPPPARRYDPPSLAHIAGAAEPPVQVSVRTEPDATEATADPSRKRPPWRFQPSLDGFLGLGGPES